LEVKFLRLSARATRRARKITMSRIDVGQYIQRYLDSNPELEIKIEPGNEGQVQTIELELHPSERMLSGLLTRAITGVNSEGSRAVTPPPEREGAKERLMKRGVDSAAPPPLFRHEDAQADRQAKTAEDTDVSTPPPVFVTPPPPAGPPTPPAPPAPRTPAAASETQEFIEELKEIAARYSSKEGIWRSREERRDQKEQCALKFWKKLLKNIHSENFTDLPGDIEGTPSGALQFYILQCQEYLKNDRVDWSRIAMKKGLNIHIERLLEAEMMNGVIKERNQERDELTKCAFVHSFRCERYLKALRKMEQELEEMGKKLQTEISKKQDIRRYYENTLVDKTRYEKIARQEFQSRQDKKISELQTQLSLAEERNKDREEKLRALKQQTEHKRTYSVLGIQIILPF